MRLSNVHKLPAATLAELLVSSADAQANEVSRLPVPGNQVVRRLPRLHWTMMVPPRGVALVTRGIGGRIPQ
jgi:hypothetical protein